MKHSNEYIMIVIFVLMVVAVCSCSSPKTTPSPSPIVESSAPISHKPGSGSNLTVTFSDGDRCTLEGDSSVKAGALQYEIYADSQEHPFYWLALVTLDNGKTLADLQAIPASDIAQPDFSHLLVANFETRDSHSTILINVDKGPLYFSCFAGDRFGVGQKIGQLGPITVEE